MDIDRSAPVITRLSHVIAAPLSTVWTVFSGESAWPPAWRPTSTHAWLDGPVCVGAVVYWRSAGLVVTATVAEVIGHERIAWSASAQGISSIHVWRFTPVADGVRVDTEQSWAGNAVQLQREHLQHSLDQSLRGWVERLQQTAESRE